MIVVAEKAIRHAGAIVEELRAVATAHPLHLLLERALDRRRVQLAQPARRGHPDQDDADASVATTRQEALERARRAPAEPVVAQPAPDLPEARDRRRVRRAIRDLPR